MESKIKKVVANVAANVCKISAESLSASACVASYFQPKEPKSLKKEK